MEVRLLGKDEDGIYEVFDEYPVYSSNDFFLLENLRNYTEEKRPVRLGNGKVVKKPVIVQDLPNVGECVFIRTKDMMR